MLNSNARYYGNAVALKCPRTSIMPLMLLLPRSPIHGLRFSSAPKSCHPAVLAGDGTPLERHTHGASSLARIVCFKGAQHTSTIPKRLELHTVVQPRARASYPESICASPLEPPSYQHGRRPIPHTQRAISWSPAARASALDCPRWRLLPQK